MQGGTTTASDDGQDFALKVDLITRSLQLRGRQVQSTTAPLFHYTSAAVFEKIIDKGNIWLTNAAYLNDPGELTYPITVGRLAVDQVRHGRTGDALGVVFDEVSRLLAYHSIFKGWYLVSVSAQGNQLSQWRAYCSRGGYSMGIQGEHLASLVSERSDHRFGPVEYEPRKQLEAVTRLIEDHLAVMDETRERHRDVPQDRYNSQLATTIVSAMTNLFVFFKSKAFEEEAEWRLVRHVLEEAAPNFFERHGILTPYFAESICTSDGRVPLQRVFVSPLGEQDLAAHSARMLLKSKGYEHYERLVVTPNYGLRFAP